MRVCNPQLAGSKRILWITLASILLLRLLTLGAYPLLDRTEARYALIAKLMVQSGNWITPMLEPGVPYLGKPPLSIWANAASYLIFGINEFAARLPPFLALLITGALVFTLAMHVNSINSKNLNLPLVATCVFASSALPFYFAGAVMPDPILLLGITLAMVAFWMRLRGAPIVWGYLFFIGLAIGMLAKGLIGVVFPVLSITAWITWHRKWDESWRGLPWISGTLLASTLVMPWFLLQQRANPEFLRYFFVEEHFGRFLVRGWTGDLYGYARRSPYGVIWVFALLAALPWSVIVLSLPLRRKRRSHFDWPQLIRDERLSYLLIWCLSPIVFFTFANAVLPSYVAPSLPPFALLTAIFLQRTEIRDGPFVAASVFLPAVFAATLFAMLIFPHSALIPTQAGIAERFERSRSASDADLYYLFRRPFSAQFYLGNKAKFLANADEARLLLRRNDHTWIAIAKRDYNLLPGDLRGDLKIVAEQNATLLLWQAGKWRDDQGQ